MAIQLNPVFAEWLEKTPEALAKFAQIVKIWYDQSNEVPPRIPSDSGPQEFKAGEKHELKTIGISDAELDAIYKGMGEAVVKEKALEYIKGFVAGVMIGG
jgi:hypothetical protein